MDRASTDPGDPLSAAKPAATQRTYALRDVGGRHRPRVPVDSISDAHRWVSAALVAILAGHKRNARTLNDLICKVRQD